MDTFLIPVEGLRLDSAFGIGPVKILAVEAVPRRVASLLGPAADRSLLTEDSNRDRFYEWSSAEVQAIDFDHAVRIVRDALDLFRVFVWSVAMVRPTSFGLPGDVPTGQFLYVQAGERVGVGWKRTGHALGHGLSNELREEWRSSVFARLTSLIGANSPKSGHARAMLAVRTLSQATLEDRADLRMLSTVIAIEAALGGGGKVYQLARRAAYLTCGPPTDPLCGRGRPACQFLTTNPNEKGAIDRLKAYEKGARLDPRERCSEWLDFVDRYADRSSLAHGDPSFLPDESDAGRDLYWALHRLLNPALTWLLDHPHDPIAELDANINILAVETT